MSRLLPLLLLIPLIAASLAPRAEAAEATPTGCARFSDAEKRALCMRKEMQEKKEAERKRIDQERNAERLRERNIERQCGKLADPAQRAECEKKETAKVKS